MMANNSWRDKFSESFYTKAKLEIYNVAVADNIILKNGCHREVPLTIYYPIESGYFPVIIFSHGAGASKDSYSYLGEFWAKNGYICIFPTHLGSDTSLLYKGGFQALKEIIDDSQTWRERPQQISFLIDSLSELEDKVNQLKGKMDCSRIGVSGHSYGAYTTILIAGAIVNMPWGENISFRDERACAFLAISPQGTGQQGLDKDSWSKIKVPVMTMAGSNDEGWEGKPAMWRMEAFNYMPPGDKYHILIDAANHFSFCDNINIERMFHRFISERVSSSTPRRNRDFLRPRLIRKYVQFISNYFWDAYLKDDNAVKDYLNSGMINIHTQGEVSIFIN